MPDNSLCKTGIMEDLRQALIVSRYEALKFLSGYKLLIFGIMMITSLLLLSIANIIFMDNPTVNSVYSSFISFVSLLALLGATLFTSTTLSSEFEERTALVLFTKPIKKSSIFLGKILIAFALNVVIFAIYYIVTTLVGLIITHDISIDLLASFGYLVTYIFTLTGIAVMFSSLMKKSSSASILTFVFVLLVPSLILAVIMLAQDNMNVNDYWYFLDSAAASITYSVTGDVVNGPRDVATMFVWGLIPMIIAYRHFIKKEL